MEKVSDKKGEKNLSSRIKGTTAKYGTRGITTSMVWVVHLAIYVIRPKQLTYGTSCQTTNLLTKAMGINYDVIEMSSISPSTYSIIYGLVEGATATLLGHHTLLLVDWARGQLEGAGLNLSAWAKDVVLYGSSQITIRATLL